MQAGNFPVNNHSQTMEISLSIFCAVMINLLFSDWAVMIAATQVYPLSSGISSESKDEPSQLLAYGCSGSVLSVFVVGAHDPLSH